MMVLVMSSSTLLGSFGRDGGKGYGGASRRGSVTRVNSAGTWKKAKGSPHLSPVAGSTPTTKTPLTKGACDGRAVAADQYASRASSSASSNKK